MTGVFPRHHVFLQMVHLAKRYYLVNYLCFYQAALILKKFVSEILYIQAEFLFSFPDEGLHRTGCDERPGMLFLLNCLL